MSMTSSEHNMIIKLMGHYISYCVNNFSLDLKQCNVRNDLQNKCRDYIINNRIDKQDFLNHLKCKFDNKELFKKYYELKNEKFDDTILRFFEFDYSKHISNDFIDKLFNTELFSHPNFVEFTKFIQYSNSLQVGWISFNFNTHMNKSRKDYILPPSTNNNIIINAKEKGKKKFTKTDPISISEFDVLMFRDRECFDRYFINKRFFNEFQNTYEHIEEKQTKKELPNNSDNDLNGNLIDITKINISPKTGLPIINECNEIINNHNKSNINKKLNEYIEILNSLNSEKFSFNEIAIKHKKNKSVIELIYYK